MTTEKQIDAWVLIPPTILHEKKIPTGAKILYGRVLGLTKRKGYCYASNDYLAEGIGLSKSTIKKYLMILYKRNYLAYKLERDKKTKEVKGRRIYPRISSTLGDYNIPPRRIPRRLNYPTSIKREFKDKDLVKTSNRGNTDGLKKVKAILEKKGLK